MVVIVDQVTKLAALSALKVGVPVEVFGQSVRWTLTFNPGGAFGMRLGGTTYYLISSLIIFLILIFYIWRHRHISYLAIPLSFVAGGAAGNIIDRFRFGEVIDFIDCEFFDINFSWYQLERWPIFNVADMAISCGITATILLILYHSRKQVSEMPDLSQPSEPSSSRPLE